MTHFLHSLVYTHGTSREHLTLLLSFSHQSIKYVSFSHPLGVAGSENLHLKLLPLVIPLSGNPNKKRDSVFSIGDIPMNKCCFHTLMVLLVGESPPKIESIGHSILREPHKYIYPFCTLWGLLAGRIPT